MPARPEYNEFSVFLESTRMLLENQPPASDLEASDSWLRELNAVMGRAAQMRGKAEAMQATLTALALQSLDVSSDEYRKLKSSSTLMSLYAASLRPKMWALTVEAIQIGYILSSAAENTRTLMSSFRLEREIESRTTVRQSSR